jgi:DNA primase small subunit
MTGAGQSNQAPPVAPAPAKPPAPTEFPPPVKATIEWLNRRFCDWYAENPPPLPDRFTRREFGYIPWPTKPGPPPFVRHLGFDSADTFHSSLARAGPHSVYYSTAYYRRPSDLKMVDKQWLGAELIFDLDADHLADVEAAKARGEEVPLANQLHQVKGKFITLLDEFLFGDFGLTDKDVWITFSGGRGYHAHVTEERLMQFGSRERREVVDYITGKVPVVRGTEVPDVSVFMTPEVTKAREWQGKVTKEEAFRLAPVNAVGWPGRISRTLWQLLDTHAFQAPRPEARKWLMGLEGIGPTTADKFLDKMERMRDKSSRDFTMEELLAQGRISHRKDPLYRVAEHALAQYTMPLAKGETDEPVTADTKRLIRLPGSLHGKSGLKVVILKRDELNEFDPLRDAVAFPMTPVKFMPRKDAEVTLGGERIVVKGGVATEVPEAAAVFWCARQGGTILDPKPPTNR